MRTLRSPELGARCAWSGAAAGRSPRPVGDAPAGAPVAATALGDSEFSIAFSRQPDPQPNGRIGDRLGPSPRVRPASRAPRGRAARIIHVDIHEGRRGRSTRASRDARPGVRTPRSLGATLARLGCARYRGTRRSQGGGRILVVGEVWPNDVTLERRRGATGPTASSDRPRASRASRPPRACPPAWSWSARARANASEESRDTEGEFDFHHLLGGEFDFIDYHSIPQFSWL